MSNSPVVSHQSLQQRARPREFVIKVALLACALLSILTTAGIIYVLIEETILFFQEVPIFDFLTGTEWRGLVEPARYGVLPLVCGTLLVAVGSAVIAVPLGLGSALYLSEYASDRARSIIKPLLEILAGIPTVVYGYFALTVVTPFLQRFSDEISIFNAASASIVVGIMILPTIASLCDDAFRAVPGSLRDAAYALGATRFEVCTRIVLPAAMSGVLASFILAFSRAIGETMAVTLAAGSNPTLTIDFRESIQTMTAYIVQVSLGDTPAGTTAYKSLFAVGMLLFLMTLAMNMVSNWVLNRYREVYE